MPIQFIAKLVQLLPIQSGMGKNGEWKKQDIIVETIEQFSKKICISIWGDKISGTQLKIGNDLMIEVDIESREYNGKWYSDFKARKIEVNNTVHYKNNDSGAPDLGESFGNEEDVLPF